MAEINAVPVGGGRKKTWGQGGNYAIPRPEDRQPTPDSSHEDEQDQVQGEAQSVERGTSSVHATPVGRPVGTPVSGQRVDAQRRREALNPHGDRGAVRPEALPVRAPQTPLPKPVASPVGGGVPVGTPVALPSPVVSSPVREHSPREVEATGYDLRVEGEENSDYPVVNVTDWEEVEDEELGEGTSVPSPVVTSDAPLPSPSVSSPRVERGELNQGSVRTGGLPHRPRGGVAEGGEDSPLPRRASTSARSGRPKAGEKAPGLQSSLVTAEDWGIDLDNPALDEINGVSEEKAKEFTRASKQIRIVPRDLEIIRLLARFRYAQAIQVARYINSSKKATDQRLTKLAKVGLLRKEEVTRGQTVWTPTAWGLAAADLDFRVIGEGTISYVTMAHTLGLVNIGIELEIGGENLLGLEEWPRTNRKGLDGSIVQGETLVTEREIRQAQQRWKKDLDRREAENAYPLALGEWMRSDRTSPSPELQVGNEAMFIIYGTKKDRTDHVPDLVVARQRNADGTPASLAIELELNPKPVREWTRILATFAESDLYGHLYYFTHKKSIADTLNKIASDLNMTHMFSMKRYTPRNGGLPFWG